MWRHFTLLNIAVLVNRVTQRSAVCRPTIQQTADCMCLTLQSQILRDICNWTTKWPTRTFLSDVILKTVDAFSIFVLKMEAARFSETSASYRNTTWWHIPKTLTWKPQILHTEELHTFQTLLPVEWSNRLTALIPFLCTITAAFNVLIALHVLDVCFLPFLGTKHISVNGG
jgi:hypothetical protein